ncbi:hypothetical protein ACPPVT_07645 [Angustibacter sp. McL0619]|uniref:hypothetical protein n=1 Tax=Angustibacter sp. McL0619 TaxID=3415676 RepID=UPI003CF740D5
MTALPSLAQLADQPTQTGGDPVLLWAEYRHTIESAIANMPRTLQRRIGPSEIGTPCDWCLGHKLAGVPEARDAAWLPWVGNMVHGGLEEVFVHANNGLPKARYLVETRVAVGEVDGVEITGSADLVDVVTLTQSDWKVVGKTSLTKAKGKGPTPEYRVQAHLYGRGFHRRGIPVQRVQIVYLPRNEPTLANAVIWGEDYDERIAVDALTRADAMAKAIRLAGPDTVLPQLARTPGCYSCPRYPNPDGSAPPAPGHAHQANPFADLLGDTNPATASAATANAPAA